jgi:hypothetical protein
MAAKARAKKSASKAKVLSTPIDTPGEKLVSRVAKAVTHSPHEVHPALAVHRKGFSFEEDVKSLAHIYMPGEYLRVNGSGLLAMAAWQRRLESEGKQPEHSDAGVAVPYTRGLTHR